MERQTSAWHRKSPNSTATCKMTEHCRSNNLDVGARENHAMVRFLCHGQQLWRRDVRTNVPLAPQLACLSPQFVSVTLTCDAFGMGQSSYEHVLANSKQAICCLQGRSSVLLAHPFIIILWSLGVVYIWSWGSVVSTRAVYHVESHIPILFAVLFLSSKW